MSRVGKKPILIPAGVEVAIDGAQVRVKGPKGTLSLVMHPLIAASVATGEEGPEVRVIVKDETNLDGPAQWGTARANIANLVEGVTKGFSKSLEVNGVGFRVAVAGRNVNLSIGFSHPVVFPLPEGIIAIAEGNILTISGMDAQVVGQTAAEIRSLRKPEPYKGKGIKYTDETIRRKAGKAAKAGAE